MALSQSLRKARGWTLWFERSHCKTLVIVGLKKKFSWVFEFVWRDGCLRGLIQSQEPGYWKAAPGIRLAK